MVWMIAGPGDLLLANSNNLEKRKVPHIFYPFLFFNRTRQDVVQFVNNIIKKFEFFFTDPGQQ